jgi:hypothetical protein
MHRGWVTQLTMLKMNVAPHSSTETPCPKRIPH